MARQWLACILGSAVMLGGGIEVRGAAPPTPTVGELVVHLGSCEDLETCEAVRTLIGRGPVIWPELRVGLESKDELVRFWTLGVLSELPIPPAREDVAARLDDPKVRVRAAAAFALGALKSKEVTPALLKALADKDLNVRFAATVALGKVKDPASAPALLRALGDDDEDVRAYAALALGEMRTPEALAPLLVRLEEDVSAKVRGFVAMALAPYADKRAYDPLSRRVKEERDPKALAAAIYALGLLGDVRAIALIEPHTKHPAAEVQEYAREALAALQPKPTPTPPPEKR